MARLVTSGGEVQDHPTTNAGSPDGYSGGAAATTTELAVKRSGVASVKCAGTSANTSFRIFPVTFASTVARMIRVWVYVDALPNATKKILAVTGGATLHCSVRLTAAGNLQLWNDRSGAVAQIGSDSVDVLVAGEFYRLNLLVNVSSASSAATANDAVELYYALPSDPQDFSPGTLVASSAAVALGSTLPTEIRVGWVDAPGVTANLYLDDLAVNDTTGTAQNSWPDPDGRVAVLSAAQRITSSTGWTTCGLTTAADDWVQALNAPPEGHADATNHTAPYHQVRVANTSTFQVAGSYAFSFGRLGVKGNVRADANPGSDQPLGSTTNTEKKGVQFYMDGTLDYVEMFLKAVGSPTDDLIVEIVQGAALGFGTTPNGGTTLLSATVPMTSLTTAGSWVRVQFPLTPLTLGQGYWLILSRSGANDAVNYVKWPLDLEVAGDHNRAAWSTAGGNFTQGGRATQPHQFRVYSTGGVGRVSFIQAVACVGSNSTTARNGDIGSPTPPVLANTAFTFPNALSGAYPTNWKWVATAAAYDPLIPGIDSGAQPTVRKLDAFADVALCCFAGVTVEWTNPPNPG
jgi:hypothetical protein